MQESEKEEKEEKDIFLSQNKIIFKKYKPIKLIGKGTFSNVYLSLNTKNNSYVAIKAEKRNPKGVELLESEAFLLYSLKGFGIPSVLSYGKTKGYNILVQPLLGKSLLDLFILRNKNISINDICLIAIQILERIEWVHSNNIVYRDIKPENFLFGKKDPEILYLIDFGLCRKYKSSSTGKHILPKNLGKFTGTSRYASVYAMAGNEQSRRDDIESIGYMIIFLMKKKLPWQGIKGHSYKECYHKLYLMKKYINLEELCSGLPSEIIDYMNNAKSLKFEQEPNYAYLKNLFYNILKKNKINIENKLFSWIKKVDINNNSNNLNILIKSNSVGKVPNSQMIRRSSPQNRLYNKIKSSIENKRNKLLIKQSQKSDKTDYTSLNTENKLNSERSNEEKIIQIKKINNNLGSELSNKVMINKNINSNYNDNIENFPRVSSENNIYHENLFFNQINVNKKQSGKNHSPENNRFNNMFYLNQHKFSDIKISDDENSRIIYNNKVNNKDNNKIELKKIHFSKNNNYLSDNNINSSGKIIKINPIKKNLHPNINVIHDHQKYYQQGQIKLVNTSNNNIENINNNINNINIFNRQNKNDNITYNTYNTYNTFNSFNNTLDKTNINNNNNNNNNNSYNIPFSEFNDFNNPNNKRINHILYQKNNNKNFRPSKKIKDPAIINDSPIIKNNQNKLIYLDKIESKREVNSVNNRKKPIKKNQNIIEGNFNNRVNNSANRIGNKQIFGNNGNIKRVNNKNMKIIRNVGPKKMTNLNKLNNKNIIPNITNINLRPSNSSNNINRNNVKKNIIDYIRIKNNNDNIKEINLNNTNVRNNIQNQNSNSLKRIFLKNSKNNLLNKMESNNNYIRLDKMKNNINLIQNTLNIYKTNKNNSKNKINPEIIPNYNNYKINTLKRIPNNFNILLKDAFQPFKYKTENDSNSVLIHKNYNNLQKINNNIPINENNSMMIIRNNNVFNINNNMNYHQKTRQIKEEKPIFDEIRTKNISPRTNITLNKSNKISESLFIDKNNPDSSNSYLNNKYKTQDIEIDYMDENNNANKTNRINKYKMIRYKGI